MRSDPGDTGIVRIAIVDDHAIMCEGLRNAFEMAGGFEVVGTASDRLGALELIENSMPDMALLDVNMPGDGVATARQISLRFPAIKTVMLTAYDDEQFISQSLRAGASGYLLKGLTAAELIGCVREILAGECQLSPGLAARLLASNNNSMLYRIGFEQDLVELTDREEVILKHIANGHSNREISKLMDLCERTIKHYVANVLQKLHVRNRIEAALTAYDQLAAKYKHNND